MKLTRYSWAFCGVLLVGAGAVLAAESSAIEKIMEKGFKKGGVRHQLTTEIEKNSPNWEKVQKNTKEFSQLCDELCKQTPPKGEKDHWTKLTGTMAQNAKKLEDLAAKKDQANVKAIMSKINGSCKDCHDVHRE